MIFFFAIKTHARMLLNHLILPSILFLLCLLSPVTPHLSSISLKSHIARMAKKRKECVPNAQNINDDRRFFVDRREIMKVTKMAKGWRFTCSFCFKKFPSAQAMGNHQNAHQSERLGIRRLNWKYPTRHRKKAYILGLKETAKQGGWNPNSNSNSNHPNYVHAAKPVVKFELKAAESDYKSYFCQPSKINGENDMLLAVTNALPATELGLVENAGVDGEGEAYMDLDIVDGYEIMELGQKLDLTLKL